MDRAELGSRLCNWHSGQWDPVYMVGSFYVGGETYPDREVVEEAISHLETALFQFQRMLADEKVMVERNGRKVDLKEFAGYTEWLLRENVADLEEIVESLKEFLAEDYSSEEAEEFGVPSADFMDTDFDTLDKLGE